MSNLWYRNISDMKKICAVCGHSAGKHSYDKGQCPASDPDPEGIFEWRQTTFAYIIYGPQLPTAEEMYEMLRSKD